MYVYVLHYINDALSKVTLRKQCQLKAEGGRVTMDVSPSTQGSIYNLAWHSPPNTSTFFFRKTIQHTWHWRQHFIYLASDPPPRTVINFCYNNRPPIVAYIAGYLYWWFVLIPHTEYCQSQKYMYTGCQQSYSNKHQYACTKALFWLPTLLYWSTEWECTCMTSLSVFKNLAGGHVECEMIHVCSPRM